MSTVRSLEEERQAILDRMQLRREAYRRMLADGEDFRTISLGHNEKPNGGALVRTDENARHLPRTTAQTYTRAPEGFPRSRLMRVVGDHPVLCALGVAAVLAIGPRRIVRSIGASRVALGALAADQSRLSLIGRVLELAGSYAKRRRS